jgi:flagellar basal-body rod protein FlgB
MIGGPDRMGAFLERAMDLAYKRQTVLQGNLANVDTPGYVARDLDFAGALAEALDAPERAPLATPVVERTEVEPGLDGNKVDLDGEMVRLASNEAFYQLATESVTRRLGLLRYAIDEGGR